MAEVDEPDDDEFPEEDADDVFVPSVEAQASHDAAAVEMRTIRETIADRVRREEQQARERWARDREARATKIRSRRETEQREVEGRRTQALRHADGRVQAEVQSAQRGLQRALQAVHRVPTERHSAEGRLQRRLAAAVEHALEALRRVRHYSFATRGTEGSEDND